MRILAIALSLLCVASAAQAKPERGKQFNDWAIDCEAGAGGKEQCFASQTQTMQTQEQQQGAPVRGGGRLLKLSVGYIGAGGKPAMVAILPLGIYLPAGAAYQVEGQAQKPLVLQRCVAEGCVAAAELDEAALGQMRKAKSLTIGFKGDPSGQTLAIPVSLKGFDAAVKSLK